jgi:predicted anti-sigma-YlaC factor YlaD
MIGKLRKLADPKLWATYGKFAAVVALEAAATPAVLVLTKVARDPDAVLAAQNRLRQRALKWLRPEWFER